MVNLDSQIIVNEIDYYGDTITITDVSSTTDDRGDTTENTTDYTGIKAMINVLSRDDEYISEGLARMGDVLFFIKGNQSYIARGNRITHDSDTYEIVEVFPGITSGTTYVYEVIARKI